MKNRTSEALSFQKLSEIISNVKIKNKRKNNGSLRQSFCIYKILFLYLIHLNHHQRYCICYQKNIPAPPSFL